MLGTKQVIEIVALHIEGKTLVEIGKAVGLSKSRVAQILKEPESQAIKAQMLERITNNRADQIIAPSVLNESVDTGDESAE